MQIEEEEVTTGIRIDRTKNCWNYRKRTRITIQGEKEPAERLATNELTDQTIMNIIALV